MQKRNKQKISAIITETNRQYDLKRSQTANLYKDQIKIHAKKDPLQEI